MAKLTTEYEGELGITVSVVPQIAHDEDFVAAACRTRRFYGWNSPPVQEYNLQVFGYKVVLLT